MFQSRFTTVELVDFYISELLYIIYQKHWRNLLMTGLI